MEETLDKITEVLDIMKESIKLNIASSEEEIERIDKIKEYLDQLED